MAKSGKQASTSGLENERLTDNNNINIVLETDSASNSYFPEDSDYSDAEYWHDNDDENWAELFDSPWRGYGLKNGKVIEKRGSNQEKFSAQRPKTLIKYGKRDVVAASALANDVDEEAKLTIKEMVENYGYFTVVNDVVCCGERSVLIHCYSHIDLDTRKPQEYLVKVYRLQFGLARTNQWALREYQNAFVMNKHVNVPNVYCPTRNIGVMRFIGDDGIPAPSLNEVSFEITEKHYNDVITCMHKLYNEAQIVHGKLSARSILWWRDKLWFISLSYAVRRQHPHALEMLMKDCCHITLFFKRKGLLKVKSIMNLFKYITGLEKIDPSVLCALKHTRKPIKHRQKKSKQLN